LGGEVADETDRRRRIEAAGQAIHDFEADLTRALIDGTDGQTGLRHLPGITVIAGLDNPARVGTVSFTLKGVPSADLVEALRDQGIRTHTRKADHYSGNILHPLQLPDCVRLSMCHYNTRQEVAEALKAIAAFVGAQDMREQA